MRIDFLRKSTLITNHFLSKSLPKSMCVGHACFPADYCASHSVRSFMHKVKVQEALDFVKFLVGDAGRNYSIYMYVAGYSSALRQYFVENRLFHSK